MDHEFLRFCGAIVFVGLLSWGAHWAFKMDLHRVNRLGPDLHDTICEEGEEL